MKKQAIPPYPTIDLEHISVAIGYFKDDSRLIERSLPDGTISLKTEEGRPWTAQNDPLEITMSIDSGEFSRLKAATRRILPEGAMAGIALMWHSKGSLRSGFSDACELKAGSKTQKAELKLNFEKAEVRDTLSFQPFVFIKKPATKVKAKDKHKGNTAGAILGYSKDNWTLRVDGRGSVFPLFTFEGGRNGPLWSLNCMWDDCMADKFDADSVRININTEHPDCPEEWKSDNDESISPLTKSIIRDAIGTLVLSIQREQDNWLAIKRTESLAKAEFETGSVAHAAWHFFTNHSLNDESPASLMETAGKITI